MQGFLNFIYNFIMARTAGFVDHAQIRGISIHFCVGNVHLFGITIAKMAICTRKVRHFLCSTNLLDAFVA
jgi:hypothetical protein